MDKLKQYQKVIRQVLTDYARFLESSPDANYKVAMLFDDEHGQYAVRRIGTWEKKRFRYTDIHISPLNGKIWIEEDMTEEGIATALLEQGIPKSDIVLGFQPPYVREQMEFAVA